jgi:hypothetical protein
MAIINGQSTIGTSAAQLDSGNSHAATYQVIVKSFDGNAGKIYVGNSNSVTTSGATGGLELIPGDSVYLSLNNSNLLWLISDDSDQLVSWTCV